MRVTSVMVLLAFELPNKALTFYRESIDVTNILLLIDLYEAWGKPEHTNRWRAKMLLIEETRHPKF